MELLGCINDMLQRDKENRELEIKQRTKEERNRLLEKEQYQTTRYIR